MAESSSRKAYGRKRKHQGGFQDKNKKKAHFNKKHGNDQHRKEKRSFKKKNMAKISASIVIPKGILHEIALNLRRYLAILKLVNFV